MIEQEAFIQKLHLEHITRNEQYSAIYLALALVTTLPYLTTLFTPSPSLLSLLSISSLLSPAYLIHSFPPGTTGIALLDKMNIPSTPQSLSARKRAMLQANDGPVKTYLPFLNLGLCVVLVGLGSVSSRKGTKLWWGFEWLPAAVYTVAMVGKWVMGSVDPEEEMGTLRYELKGA